MDYDYNLANGKSFGSNSIMVEDNMSDELNKMVSQILKEYDGST
jgi:hypothetical protein